MAIENRRRPSRRLLERAASIKQAFTDTGLNKYYILARSNKECADLLASDLDELGIYQIGDATPYGDVVAIAIGKPVFFHFLDEEGSLGILVVIQDGDEFRIGLMVGDRFYDADMEEIEGIASEVL